MPDEISPSAAPDAESSDASFVPKAAEAEAPEATVSDAAQERESSGRNWFRSKVNEFLNRAPTRQPRASEARAESEPEAETEPAPSPEAAPARAQRAESEPAQAERPPKPGPVPPGYTVISEDDKQRLIQAETDRRIAKWQAEQQRRQSVQQRQSESERLEKLRREDPVVYAEERHAADQRAAFEQQLLNEKMAVQEATMRDISRTYDLAVVEPVLQHLTMDERAVVLKSQPQGVKGRTILVQKAIDTLRKRVEKDAYERGLAEGEEKARSSKALRKQILAELRESEEEPDLAPAGAPSRTRAVSNNGYMNDLFHRMAGRG